MDLHAALFIDMDFDNLHIDNEIEIQTQPKITLNQVEFIVGHMHALTSKGLNCIFCNMVILDSSLEMELLFFFFEIFTQYVTKKYL